MAESIIFKGSSGLNNKIDPLRHPYNPETGIGSLAEVINCDIDDTGMISRRLGQSEISSVVSHSIFCDDGDCFVTQDRTDDAAIYQLGTDFITLTGVRSGLTKSAKIAFVQDGSRTFYSNGYQNGYIESGSSLPWPTEGHVGVSTTREFYPAPLGTHLDIWLGRMWIAEGSVLWVSEPYAYGKFNKAKYFFEFGTDITMMKHVEGGMWVSDSSGVGFISKEDSFDSMKFIQRRGAPAHAFSANIKLVDLSYSAYKIQGKSAVWSSDDGITVGTENGELIIITEDKLYYPNGSNGATIIVDGNVINSVY